MKNKKLGPVFNTRLGPLLTQETPNLVPVLTLQHTYTYKYIYIHVCAWSGCSSLLGGALAQFNPRSPRQSRTPRMAHLEHYLGWKRGSVGRH